MEAATGRWLRQGIRRAELEEKYPRGTPCLVRIREQWQPETLGGFELWSDCEIHVWLIGRGITVLARDVKVEAKLILEES